MEEIIFECEHELAIKILSLLEKECECVSCIGMYKHICDLATAIIAISDGEYGLVNVDLHDEYYENYEKEYILTLDKEGIWIQKMCNEEYDGKYVELYDEDVVFVHENCNSSILKGIDEDSLVVIFSYESDIEEEQCEEDCYDCPDYPMCHSKIEDEKIETEAEEIANSTTGFTYNVTRDDGGYSSYSFYSTDKDLVDKTRKEIIEKWN